MSYKDIYFLVKRKIFSVSKIIFKNKYYDFLMFVYHLRNDKFKGYSLKNNLKFINNIIKKNNINSLIDYGCGKAMYYSDYPFEKKNLDIFLYDPYFIKYKKLPKKKYELLICTDVMEHIQKHEIEESLIKMDNYSIKNLYFSICTRPAKKILPDGQNAHVTLMSKQAWIAIIKKNISKEKKVYIKFDTDETIEEIN
jgi:hypothetical protein